MKLLIITPLVRELLTTLAIVFATWAILYFLFHGEGKNDDDDAE